MTAIMNIVSAYGQELKDYGHTESSENTFSLIRTAIEELHRDAERYLDVRRGQKWSVIDGIGDTLRADDLDAAIDAAMKKPVVDAEKASKPRYVLRTCEECWGVGESEKYGYDDYSCGFCRDCMGTGKVAILKEST